MSLSPDDEERLEASRITSRTRAQQFLEALPPELSAWDDRIEAETLRENASLKSKLGKLYRLVDAVSATAAPFVACRRSCGACCRMNVSISVVEAERLAAVSGRQMTPVARPVRHRAGKFNGTPCPFLVDEECSVYEARPFACRAHLSFDVDSYWCQPERSHATDMGMVRMGGAKAAYEAIAGATKLGGFADIRDFFPAL